MNFYDYDDFYEQLNEAEIKEDNAIECEVMQNRPRYSTLEDALNYDKEYVNKLLNKDKLSKVEKHWIASFHNKVCYEYVDSNKTIKSWEDFLQDRLGDKYEQLIKEWLQMCDNEFFQRVGMDEQMKPSAVYLWGKEF